MDELKTIKYIPDFITEEEEDYLLNKVNDAPKPKWTQLSNRRLQNWGGVPHPKGMIPEKMPIWLQVYIDRIHQNGFFEDKHPNHVLVNEYLPGQGIMPHKDGPLFYPTISTITLGSHTVLDFYEPLPHQEELELTESELLTRSQWRERHKFSLFLKPRSLLVLKDDCYTHYLHGIEERNSDTIDEKILNVKEAGVRVNDCLNRDTRVSLTIRFVPKVSKIRIRL